MVIDSNVFSKIFMKDSLNSLDTGDKIIALPTQDTDFYQIKNAEQYLAACYYTYTYNGKSYKNERCFGQIYEYAY